MIHNGMVTLKKNRLGLLIGKRVVGIPAVMRSAGQQTDANC